MSAIDTLPPTVLKVCEIDGHYADERELLLAAYADGLSVEDCRALVSELMAEFDKEFAAQAESEIAAENAWLYHAENAGFWESEAEYRYHGAY